MPGEAAAVEDMAEAGIGAEAITAIIGEDITDRDGTAIRPSLSKIRIIIIARPIPYILTATW